MGETMTGRRGATLLEVLVASSIFSLILIAILSFYIEASAVSAKRDEQSSRLRRYHLALDKTEQILREARVLRVGARVITFLRLADTFEREGFPAYQAAAQIISSKEGMILFQGTERQELLKIEEGENVFFGWTQYDPPGIPGQHLMKITIERPVSDKGRQLLFTRSMLLNSF